MLKPPAGFAPLWQSTQYCFTNAFLSAAFGAVGVLVFGIVVAGLWPNPLIEIGQRGAAEMVDTGRYVEAVGLRSIAP